MGGGGRGGCGGSWLYYSGCTTVDVKTDVKIVQKARCAHLREKPGYVDRAAILCTVYLPVEAGVAARSWARTCASGP